MAAKRCKGKCSVNGERASENPSRSATSGKSPDSDGFESSPGIPNIALARSSAIRASVHAHAASIVARAARRRASTTSPCANVGSVEDGPASASASAARAIAASTAATAAASAPSGRAVTSAPPSGLDPSAADIAAARSVVNTYVSAVIACAHACDSRSTWSPVFRARGFIPCIIRTHASVFRNGREGVSGERFEPATSRFGCGFVPSRTPNHLCAQGLCARHMRRSLHGLAKSRARTPSPSGLTTPRGRPGSEGPTWTFVPSVSPSVSTSASRRPSRATACATMGAEPNSCTVTRSIHRDTSALRAAYGDAEVKRVRVTSRASSRMPALDPSESPSSSSRDDAALVSNASDGNSESCSAVSSVRDPERSGPRSDLDSSAVRTDGPIARPSSSSSASVPARAPPYRRTRRTPGHGSVPGKSTASL